MSEKLAVQRAQYAYSQFINDLSPAQARFVALGERDLPVPAQHMVTRDEMCAAFLANHPEFEPQRAAFADVDIVLSQFPVVTARWNALIGGGR